VIEREERALLRYWTYPSRTPQTERSPLDRTPQAPQATAAAASLKSARQARRVIRVENDDAKGQWLGLVASAPALAVRRLLQLLLPSACAVNPSHVNQLRLPVLAAAGASRWVLDINFRPIAHASH